MDIKTLWNNLDVGALGLGWAYFRNGWAGIAEYLCDKFSSLLGKLPAEDLKRHSETVRKVADLIESATEYFITDESVKAAAINTTDAISSLAEHLSDGRYTKDELDNDISAVKDLIGFWKTASAS